MAKRGQVTWAELRVGLLVLFAMTLLAVFVFYVTGGGRFFAERADYTTYLPSVAGLKAGAPVRLMGLRVGSVDSIALRDFHDDPSQRTEVRFHVDLSYQEFIRDNSVAFITTEGLLGESVLEIETESLAGEVIPSGGLIASAERGDIKRIIQNVDEITSDVRSLTGDLRAGKGTLGGLFTDRTIYNRANRIVAQIEGLTKRAAAGEGTIGRLMVREDLYEKLSNAVADVNQITADIRAGKGTVGGLLYDRKLYDQASSMMTRADDVVARVQSGQGTLGKLITDDALHRSLNATFQNAADISRKMNDGEGTIGRALHDTRLYENVNNFTSELRGLLSDFRKNPKKFLRIKASIF